MSFISTAARTVNFTRVFSTMGELFIENMISSPNEVSVNCVMYTQHYVSNEGLTGTLSSDPKLHHVDWVKYVPWVFVFS